MSLATEFLPFWRSRPVGEPAWILLAFYIFFFPPLFSNFPVSYLPNASKLLLNYFCSKQYFLMNFRLHSTNLDDKKRTSLLFQLCLHRSSTGTIHTNSSYLHSSQQSYKYFILHLIQNSSMRSSVFNDSNLLNQQDT
jgi:hypothetical protein